MKKFIKNIWKILTLKELKTLYLMDKWSDMIMYKYDITSFYPHELIKSFRFNNTEIDYLLHARKGQKL